MKKANRIWELKTYGERCMSLMFSSKKKALQSIELWADNSGNPFVVSEDTGKMNKISGSEIIHLEYRSGNVVMMFLHKTIFNNASDLTLLGRN
jgi:hypothetical protein